MSLFELWLIFTLIPQLNGLGHFLAAAGVVGMVVYMAVRFFAWLETTDTPKGVNAFLKWGLICGVLGGIVVTVTPNSEQMKYIVGTHVVTNIEGVKELPDELVDMTRELVKELKENAKPETK